MSHNYGDLYERGYIDGLYNYDEMKGMEFVDEYSMGHSDGIFDRLTYYGWRQFKPGDKIPVKGKWTKLAEEFFIIGDIVSKMLDQNYYVLDPLCLRDKDSTNFYMFLGQTWAENNFEGKWVKVTVEQRQIVCAILGEIEEREE